MKERHVWSSIENNEGDRSIMNAIDSTIEICSGRGEFRRILGNTKRFIDDTSFWIRESNNMSRETILKKSRTANRTIWLVELISETTSVKESCRMELTSAFDSRSMKGDELQRKSKISAFGSHEGGTPKKNKVMITNFVVA